MCSKTVHALWQIMHCQLLIGKAVRGVYSNYFMGNAGSFLAKAEWGDEPHCIRWGKSTKIKSYSKSTKIKSYISMSVPTFPIMSVEVKDLNRSWCLHIQLLSFYQAAVIAGFFPTLSSMDKVIKLIWSFLTASCDVICWRTSWVFTPQNFT